MIAAFIDFQGTLGGSGFDDITTFDFFPFSIEAIKKLNDNGILVIGITNQSRIAKGYLSLNDYENHLSRLKNQLAVHHAHFDAVYCCPHQRSDECSCKKPKIGMIESALKEFEINIQNSYVIGDMGMNDVVLARNIGAKAILVLTGVGESSLNEYRYMWQNVEPDYIAENVLEAAEYIISAVHSDKHS